MNKIDFIIRAREFARVAHTNQRRRYTDAPYFDHLEEVANMVVAAGVTPDVIAAAWLHDVLEDQPVSYADLAYQFGGQVADIVLELTNEPLATGNRASKKAKDLARLAAASPAAQTIKCADLISNTATIVDHDPSFAAIYLPEKRAILEVLLCAELTLYGRAWETLRRAEELLASMQSNRE